MALQLINRNLVLQSSLPRELGKCVDSVYQAFFSLPLHKSLGMRLHELLFSWPWLFKHNFIPLLQVSIYKYGHIVQTLMETPVNNSAVPPLALAPALAPVSSLSSSSTGGGYTYTCVKEG